MITMRPGEVQLWRIANTSSRGGVFVTGFVARCDGGGSAAVFAWKQIAQDGVQFTGRNYDRAATIPTFVLAPATAPICWCRHRHPARHPGVRRSQLRDATADRSDRSRS